MSEILMALGFIALGVVAIAAVVVLVWLAASVIVGLFERWQR